MDNLQQKTMQFFLGNISNVLKQELDWRAHGEGLNALQRTGIYIAAFVRDLARIPLHSTEGIAQARFRSRIDYIQETALPTMAFFLENYPLSEQQSRYLNEASLQLSNATQLISDGRVRGLDEWYATMDEFHDLFQHSEKAVSQIQAALND